MTRAVKLKLPDAVGVPLTTPVPLDSVRPGGKAPTGIDQLKGVVPPVASSVWLYAEVNVASGRLEVVTTGTGFTTILKA